MGRGGTTLFALHSDTAAENSIEMASSQNCNNSCSSNRSSQRVCPPAESSSDALTVRARVAAHELATKQMSSTPRRCRPPLPLVSPTVAPRQNAPACQLPSPLVPCPCSQSASSVAVSSHVTQSPLTAKPVAASPINVVRPNQLPVYFTPACRPNAIPQPTGYSVPFCSSQPGCSARPGVCLNGGMLPSSANISQHVLMTGGTFQPCLPPSHPRADGQLPPQACVSSAPSGVVPRPVSHVASDSRNDVPLKSTNFTAMTTAVQSQTVTDGLSPQSSPDVCPSLSDMHLNDADLRLLHDAMKEERAALGVGSHMPAGHVTCCLDSHGVTSVRPHGIDASSAESDSSLSDWSIIDLPAASSVSVDMIPGQASVTSLASPSLMHFSTDSACSDLSGPMPGRSDQFPAQKLSPRPGSSCVYIISMLYSTVNWLF